MKRSVRWLSALMAALLLMSTFVLGANAAPGDDPYELPIIDGDDPDSTFFAPPVLTTVKSAVDGVALSWSAVDEVVAYQVFRGTDASDLTALAVTDGTTYTDTTAESGKRYTYAVQCYDPINEDDLSALSEAKSVDFVKAPSITSFSNTATGTKVTWDKPDGAAKCRLYYKNGSSWTRLAETDGISFVHDGLKDGTTTTYTVRGLDGSGSFVTDFDRDGWTNTFIAPPVIASFTNTAQGVVIRWNEKSGAEWYRVYVAGDNGWMAIGDTDDTTFTDTGVQSGKTYKYTVRCISADKKRFMSHHTGGKSTKYIGVPTIASISNTDGGAKITVQKPVGSDRVRIYMLGAKGWVKLTETSSDSYVHNKLSDGSDYTYTVRCVDAKGNFVSDFDRQGWNNTYLAPPVITSLTNTETGVQIRWGANQGAEMYRVYVKSGKSWTKLTDTAGTSYLDTNVTSGKTYQYTVRCITADAKRFTSYHNSGKSIQYVGMPKITAFANTATGAKITFTKPAGAAKIRVYTKGASGWTRVAETTATSCIHDKLTNGKQYTYTVRCLDSKGNLVSAYNTTGWNNTFFAPPALPTVTAASNGNLLKWKAVSGIPSFRPFRKTFGGSWSRLTDKVDGVSYTDTTAKANTLYAYTLRCMDGDGNLVSSYKDSNIYYYNGKLANGDITVGSNKLHFADGVLRSGYQTINGKTYYYNSSGVLMKNGIVGSAKDGYCYADKNGVIDYTYRNGVTYGGNDWNVLDGKAYKVTTEKERTLFRALKLVYKVTDRSMTKAEKLKKCFNYILTAGYTEKNPRIPHYTGMDWPIIYANDVFVNGVGNCISFAAAFGYMAKAIGYENVYGCHSGGHGWTEIDGRVYDPEWRMHHSGYSYYGMTYTEPCDVKYASGIAAGYAWMHVKI